MQSTLVALLLVLLPLLANADISGYGESPAAAAPSAAAPAAAAPECDESVSEAKANGPNPFCVYPALVGDHPSPGNRPGPTHAVDIPPGESAPSPAAEEAPAPAPVASAPAPSASVASAPAASAPVSSAPSSAGYSKFTRIRAFRSV